MISRIWKNIYISGADESREILSGKEPKHGFGYVINLSNSTFIKTPAGSNIDYQHILLAPIDNTEADIRFAINTLWTMRVSSLIHRRNRKILVHCAAGIDRSVIITAAMLMKTLKFRYILNPEYRFYALVGFVQTKRMKEPPDKKLAKQVCVLFTGDKL